MTVPRPEQARTPAEFVASLRALKEWSGLSYRVIERRAREAGDHLPASTVATMLGRKSLPRLDLLSALVRACGTDPEDVRRWIEARRRLAQQHEATPAAGAGPGSGGTAHLPAPRQLPLDVPTFVGRRSDLAELVGVLAAPGPDRPGPVVVLHGIPGVGKSALAVRVAHLTRRAFPDGQLYVNLRGATPAVTPVTPVEALSRFLRALGLDPAVMPHELEERAALYRSMVADRRMLILLDDAASEAQLRPLLPGGHGIATVVTSRSRLAGLEGAVHRNVGPLDRRDVHSMFRATIGEERTNADPAAVGRLAELCGHLPLGLHVAASRLKTRPTWRVADLVDRLSDERRRLGELRAGDVAVQSSIGVSIAALANSDEPIDRSAAEAFALFGALPVAEIDPGLSSVLLDTSRAEADRVAERLGDAHLLETMAPGHYRMHDLVRLVAREHAERTAPARMAAALTRVLGYYLATVRHASRLAYPHRVPYPTPDPPPSGNAEHEPLRDPGQARRWLEENRSNILLVAGHALDGSDEHARLGLGLALALHWSLVHAFYPYDAIRLAERAVRVAERLGDEAAAGYAHGMLGCHLSTVERLDEAHRALTAELAIFERLGDRFAQQRALGNLGRLETMRGRPAAAVPMLERQRYLARSIGAEIGEIFAANQLGLAYVRLGRHAEAAELLGVALEWAERRGDGYHAAHSLQWLAKVHVELGELDEAAMALERSIEHARRVGNSNDMALLLTELAAVWRLMGAPDRAADCVRAALALTATNNDAGVLSKP
ncbi:tetratricopeptide repeat protein [Micromonospora sp. URMC 103]|uniref:tetratricopeptide repeat protein n=1 Tax=Micromonospora sp. URMC 103 TaxID=3423406 RepID=UPI003F1BA093